MSACKKIRKNTKKNAGKSVETPPVDLPVDVVETIMSRLPVKSLLRFKAVCKSWEAAISDPRFSKSFSIRQSMSRNLFLFWRDETPLHPTRRGFSGLIKVENSKLRVVSEMGKPFANSHTTPVCSCNGIVLLKDYIGNNMLTLWNPSIRKQTMVHCPQFDRHFSYGLYYDPRFDDYKIVIFSNLYYSVFSCKTRKWSEKKQHSHEPNDLFHYTAVFCDGSFYWSRLGVVVYFDVRDDKWKTLQEPDDMKEASETALVCLNLLSGRLCLCWRNGDRTMLQLWVMEKPAGRGQSSSWRELMKTEKEEAGLIFYSPVCLTNEDNVVIRLKRSRYVMYNIREKRFEKSWRFDGIYYSKLLLCTESFAFPIQNINEEAGV